MAFWGFMGIMIGFWILAFLFYCMTEFFAQQKEDVKARRERRAARNIKSMMYRASVEADEIEQCYRHLQEIKSA